jgi:hypothetical protein
VLLGFPLSILAFVLVVTGLAAGVGTLVVRSSCRCPAATDAGTGWRSVVPDR